MFVHETLNYVVGQLCVTVAIVASMYSRREEVGNYVQENPTITWYPITGSFITLIMLFCCVKHSSTNIRQLLFWMFTLFCGAMVGISTIQYAPQVVLNATVTLLVMVGFINIWAYNTAKKGHDLTYLFPSLIGMVLTMFTVSILNIFIQNTFVENCITVAGVLVFSLLLLYDLNHLYIGAEENDYADPLVAAINIYLDIINIFLYLLRLFNGGSED
jgi:FtsH-binding integral membrane protein